MLKKTSGFVLVHPLHEAMQWVPVKASTYRKKYASTFHSLRPRWAAFLNILEMYNGIFSRSPIFYS